MNGTSHHSNRIRLQKGISVTVIVKPLRNIYNKGKKQLVGSHGSQWDWNVSAQHLGCILWCGSGVTCMHTGVLQQEFRSLDTIMISQCIYHKTLEQ